MRLRRGVRRLLLGLAGLPLVAAQCTPTPPPYGTVSGLGRVTTLAESGFGMFIERDCGYSRRIPTEPWNDLWVFCDTVITAPSRQITSFTGSAAIGQIPGTLPGLPAQLGDNPSPGAQLLPPGGAGWCPAGANGPLKWISGLSSMRGRELVIFYSGMCAFPGGSLFVGGWGGAVYNVDLQRVTWDPGPIFTSATGLSTLRILYTPVPVGNYWYFYAVGPAASDGLGSLAVARVPMATWSNPGDYQWWWGDGWTSAPAIPPNSPRSTNQPSADYYPATGSILLILPQNLQGSFDIYEANPASPQVLSRRYSNVSLPACKTTGWTCYHVIGHPELSTLEQIAISFFDRADSLIPVPENYGHVNLVQLSLRWSGV